MALQESELRKVAQLAQLQLSEDELMAFGDDLNAIVHLVEQLNEVDVAGVEPVAQVSGLQRITRPDQAAAVLSTEEIFAGAPRHNDRAFLVPKAVKR